MSQTSMHTLSSIHIYMFLSCKQWGRMQCMPWFLAVVPMFHHKMWTYPLGKVIWGNRCHRVIHMGHPLTKYNNPTFRYHAYMTIIIYTLCWLHKTLYHVYTTYDMYPYASSSLDIVIDIFFTSVPTHLAYKWNSTFHNISIHIKQQLCQIWNNSIQQI